MNILADKYQKLQELLMNFGEVIIAFSGGVDSTLLAKIAFDVLQEKAIAITIDTQQFSQEELIEAKALAELIGIKHYIIKEGVDSSWFENNPPDRCYICKSNTLGLIKDFCKKKNLSGEIIEGSNYDDMGDYRPGFQAVKEHGVKSPLLDAGLTKKEIRTLSKELGLPCWDKSASPCLATRFLFGEKITAEKLQMVFEAEKSLRQLGIKQVRVRVHNNIARIEVEETDQLVVINNAQSIAKKLKTLGFEYVTLDLDGYKKGSMNKKL